MNPLFNQLSTMNPKQNDLVSRFQKFRQSISGNPQEQIQKMLNSGQITQDQYNKAVQQAQSLARILGMK